MLSEIILFNENRLILIYIKENTPTIKWLSFHCTHTHAHAHTHARAHTHILSRMQKNKVTIICFFPYMCLAYLQPTHNRTHGLSKLCSKIQQTAKCLQLKQPTSLFLRRSTAKYQHITKDLCPTTPPYLITGSVPFLHFNVKFVPNSFCWFTDIYHIVNE